MRTLPIAPSMPRILAPLLNGAFFLLVLLLAESAYAQDYKPTFIETETLSYSRSNSPEPRPIEVQVVSQARCMRGDLDVMMLDFQNSNRKSVLQMSIESLGSYRDVARVGKIDPEYRPKNGVIGEFEVALPIFDSPTVLGVYLCAKPRAKDQDAPGPNAANPEQQNSRCSTQKIVPFDDLMRPHRVDTGKVFGPDGGLKRAPLLSRRLTGPSKRVYFFRYVIAYQNTLYVPTDFPAEKDYAQLQSYLSQVQADVKSSEELVKKIKEDNETLGSMPLEKSKGGLQITLPYYDAKKCGSVKSRTRK